MQDTTAPAGEHTTPRSIRDVLVGRTAEGLEIFLTIELRAPQGTGTTTSTTHTEIPRPLELAITAGTVGHLADFVSCGQIVDEMRTAVPDPASAWSQGDLDSLVAIWDRWHLNTLRAGCAHQPPESVVWETEPYRRVDLENTPRCPETGYKWGSAWLAEALPDDVLVEVHRLMGLPAGPDYAAARRMRR